MLGWLGPRAYTDYYSHVWFTSHGMYTYPPCSPVLVLDPFVCSVFSSGFGSSNGLPFVCSLTVSVFCSVYYLLLFFDRVSLYRLFAVTLFVCWGVFS